AEVAGERASGIADRRDRERDRYLRAVAADERPVSRVGVRRSRAVPQDTVDGHAELDREALELLAIVKQVRAMAPDEFVRAVAQHQLGAAVEDRDQAVGVRTD